MITDIKNRVNQEVLLRNAEIVESAISVFLNLKNNVRESDIWFLENIAKQIETKLVELPIKKDGKIEFFSCLLRHENLLFPLKKWISEEPINSYRDYLIDTYKTFCKNFDDFLSQDFETLSQDIDFMTKVKFAVDSTPLGEMQAQIESKYRKMVNKSLSIFNDTEDHPSLAMTDPDAYSYWRHDNLPTDWHRSALSDLNYMKSWNKTEENIRW